VRIQNFALIAAVIAAILGTAAPPASALGGKLGVQASLVKNSLTGELPKDGSWQGRSGFGAGLVIELDLAVDVAISLQPKFTPRYSSQVFKENGEIVRTVDSDIDYLGRSSTTLTFGSNIKFSDHYELSIAVGENVDVPSAPDVSFLLALRYRGE
jgi:hypothetical protein